MKTEQLIDELVARIRLSQGAQTLLMLVVPEQDGGQEADLDRVAEVLSGLLQHSGVDIQVLPGARSAGPSSWAKAMQGRRADAWLAVLEPAGKLARKMVAQQLNAQRQQLRELTGPLLVLVSPRTENLIQAEAPDFHTWRAATYAIPPLREIEAWALKSGALDAGPREQPRPSADRPLLRFLHLSDLHLRPDDARRYDQDRVLRGLLKYLEGAGAKTRPDLIFLTGDLAYSGNEAEYALVVSFLQELVKTTQVPLEHVFLVPGNHDVDRSVGRWLRRTLESDEDSTAFFVDEGSRRWHEQKFAAFQKAMTGFLGTDRSLGMRCGARAVEVAEIRGHRIAVASFNSAWFAQDDEDRSKLWLGEANVDRACQRVHEAAPALAVALMHHPLDYFAEVERPQVESYLERTFDLVLRGHLHSPKSIGIRSARGEYLEIAAPAAYQGSRWPNGCFLGAIDVEGRDVELMPLQFGTGSDPWVVDTKVFPDDGDTGYRHTFKLRRTSRGPQSFAKLIEPELKNLYAKLGRSERQEVQRELGITAQNELLADEAVLRKLRSSDELKDFWRVFSQHAEHFVTGDELTRMAYRLAEYMPGPEKKISLGQEKGMESLLFGFAEFWQSRGAAWIERDFGTGPEDCRMFLGAYLCRAAQEAVKLEEGRFGGNILLGSEQAVPQLRAVVDVEGTFIKFPFPPISPRLKALRRKFNAAHVALVIFPYPESRTRRDDRGSVLEKLDVSDGLPIHVLRLG